MQTHHGRIMFSHQFWSYPCSAKDCKPKSHCTIEEDAVPNTLFPVPSTMQGDLRAIENATEPMLGVYAITLL